MIKPEDLKVGDLVRISHDCAFPKGTMCITADIRPDQVFKNKKGAVSLTDINDDDDGPWGTWCCNIEGIPLTSKILNKNGWEDVEYHRSLKERFECVVFKRPDTCVEIQYYRPQDEYAAFFHGEKLCGITCIHELQNILASIKEDIKITI